MRLETCDCMSCVAERTNPYFDREEAPVSKTITCTCAARYVRDGEHDSDCDLWLIDEFWAGFLAWDWERELLTPTDKHPNVDDSDFVYVPQTLDDYDTAYEWVDDSPVQQKLSEMELRERDIALTTDMFIDRMLGKLPEDTDDTWSKGDDGLWRKTEGHRTVVSNVSPTPSDGKWSNDWSGYTNWSDRHCETPLVLPNGVTVQGTSLSKAWERKGAAPDFGLYVDSGWKPEGMAIMLPWQDYGLPRVSYQFAKYAIEEAYSWAEAGAVVEVGCIGAHGRTGTVFACMVILADVNATPEFAIQYVRGAYCDHAIESRDQEWFVAWFHAQIHGLPTPEKPVYAPPPKKVEVQDASPKADTHTRQSHSGGATGKPKARRSKRGGRRQRRRQRRHQNRTSQGRRQ